MKYISLALLFSTKVFASSVFYEPKELQKDEKDYNISHQTSLAVAIGDNHFNGGNQEPLNGFQKSRINVNSLVEISDIEKNHKAVAEFRLGTNAMEDRSSMVYLNQGYIEMQNTESQPLRAKVSFGLQNTASHTLAVNSSTVMKNSQGLSGQWYRFIQMPVINQNGGYNSTFILQNSSLISQGFGDATFLNSQNNGLLNYVQPNPNWSTTNVGIGFSIQRIAGFKTSFTYQPFGNSGNFNGTTGNAGFDRRGIATNAGTGMFMKDITSFAINYLNEWKGISLNTTLSAEMANFQRNSTVTIDRNRIAQYTFGINLSYIGFTFGGSYSHSGQSLLLKPNAGQINSFATTNESNLAVSSISNLTQLQNVANTTNLLQYQDAYNYDYGISYAFSRYQIGIAQNRSRFMNNEANATVISLSEDLKSFGGIKLTTAFEAGMYEFNPASYFVNNGGVISIAKPKKTNGYFGYFSLIASI